MARIEEFIVQKVLEAADIVDVVGEFVELKKKGARYIGLCPFHDDRHATNFVVYPAKNCYKCFACGEGGDAVKFLMKKEGMTFDDAIRWLGRRYGIDVDDKTVNLTATKRQAPPPLPTMYLPKKMIEHSMKRTSNFHRWLNRLPWNMEQKARVESVLDDYCVGATKDGWPLFWQIDETGTARTGHCMRYDDDGHRTKTGYATDWIHAMLRRDVVRDEYGYPVKDDAGEYVPKYPQYAEEKVEMRQTLFGMHLLKKYPGADVHIVESEKTALFAAIYFGNDNHNIWMACSGKYNLTRERLKPIIDQRRVIALHPDKDATEEWEERMKALGYNRTYINNTILTLYWKEVDGPKADIADVLIRKMREAQQRPAAVGALMATNPAVRKLMEQRNEWI